MIKILIFQKESQSKKKPTETKKAFSFDCETGDGSWREGGSHPSVPVLILHSLHCLIKQYFSSLSALSLHEGAICCVSGRLPPAASDSIPLCLGK